MRRENWLLFLEGLNVRKINIELFETQTINRAIKQNETKKKKRDENKSETKTIRMLV